MSAPDFRASSCFTGPGSCTVFFNPIINVEYQGEWFARLIEKMDEVAAPTLF